MKFINVKSTSYIFLLAAASQLPILGILAYCWLLSGDIADSRFFSDGMYFVLLRSTVDMLVVFSICLYFALFGRDGLKFRLIGSFALMFVYFIFSSFVLIGRAEGGLGGLVILFRRLA